MWIRFGHGSRLIYPFPVLRKTGSFIHRESRPAFHFLVDFAQVFTDDAEREQLDSAEE